MNRGEIRFYTFKAPDKRRPVLILTRDSIISKLEAVTVAPLTTTIRGVASEVVLSPEDGLPQACAINLHNLQTVQKSSIGPLIATLKKEKILKVQNALLFALGFDN